MSVSSVFAVTAILVALAGLHGSPAHASTHASTEVTLSAGAGAPQASGQAEIKLTATQLQGSVEVENLPAQPFGSGRFYGVWFVRADGSKAFLGALIDQHSIIFSSGGAGETEFAATVFTTGPDQGKPIALGPGGTNVIVVLIENNINGLTPSPVGPVPGTGVAVIGTF
jgi:hypothetical protein